MSSVYCPTLSELDKDVFQFENLLSENDCPKEIKEIAAPLFNEIYFNLLDSQIKTKHLRETVAFHVKLIKISRSVLQHEKMRTVWLRILNRIHNKPIYNVGFGISKLKCTHEIRLLEGKQLKTITIEKLDPKNEEALNQTIKALKKIDAESLGTYIREGFYRNLLLSPQTVCYISKIEQKTIGWCWGTLLSIRGMRVFHIWGLARQSELSGYDVTNKLKAELDKWLLEDVKAHYLTFRVESDNKEAIEVYKKLGFEIPETNEEAYHIYKALSDTVKVFVYPPTRAEVKKACTKLVVQAMGYLTAIRYEGARQVIIKARKLYYR